MNGRHPRGSIPLTFLAQKTGPPGRPPQLALSETAADRLLEGRRRQVGGRPRPGDTAGRRILGRGLRWIDRRPRRVDVRLDDHGIPEKSGSTEHCGRPISFARAFPDRPCRTTTVTVHATGRSRPDTGFEPVSATVHLRAWAPECLQAATCTDLTRVPSRRRPSATRFPIVVAAFFVFDAEGVCAPARFALPIRETSATTATRVPVTIPRNPRCSKPCM